MAEKGTKGFWVIERYADRTERTSFHEDEASVQREVARALKKNGGNPPPLSETDVIVIPATQYTSK
jgi:hypothetical protein